MKIFATSSTLFATSMGYLLAVGQKTTVDAFRPSAAGATTSIRNLGSGVLFRSSSSAIASTAGNDGDIYDLVVIGGGSGGVRASRISAGYGKKVAIIEPQLEHGAPNYSAIGGTVCFCLFESLLLQLQSHFLLLFSSSYSNTQPQRVTTFV